MLAVAAAVAATAGQPEPVDSVAVEPVRKRQRQRVMA
jgi:hypothetical protein